MDKAVIIRSSLTNYTFMLPQTLHSVCRIAEVLINLQQAGNVKYIGWRMELYCQTLLVEDLQKLAKSMEDELVEWNKEVTLARKKFYELNYYTMRQLLVLRGELGELKNGRSLIQCGQVMALLESISSEIIPSTLVSLVQAVDSEPLMDDSEDEEEAHSPVHPSAPAEIDHSIESITLPPLPSVDQLGSGREDTGQGVPHPRLSLEDLNDEQNAYYIDIIEGYGYCEMTALKAIEQVGDGDWNDIENWLEENADKCEESFRGAQDEDGGYGDPEEYDILGESEGEEDEQSGPDVGANPMPTKCDRVQSKSIHLSRINTCILLFAADVGVSQSPGVGLSSSSQPQSRVVFTERPVIDESNEEVQELLEAEMGTVEQCIRAIELYGTAHNAIHYMMETEERVQMGDVELLTFSPVHNVSSEFAQEMPGFVFRCFLCYCNNGVVKHIQFIGNHFTELTM